MITGEGRGTIGDGEVKGKVTVGTCIITPHICHREVGENSLFFSNRNYSNYLCFTVSIQVNHLNPEYGKGRYTPKQRELYTRIKSLHDGGLSYRKISKHLNDSGIPTHENKRWGSSGNSVYSVLKRYREREERLERRNRKYEPVMSKMWIEYSEG